MEKTLTTITEHEITKTTITIDNSTDFKDFVILNEKKISHNSLGEKPLRIQLSKGSSQTDKLCLEIGDIVLIGREVELLKEFLNQF